MTAYDAKQIIRMAREGLAESKLCEQAGVRPEFEAHYRAAYLERRIDAIIRELEKMTCTGAVAVYRLERGPWKT